MPGPSRKYSWWTKDRRLYTLLQKFSESEASDPRDLVYALLGISSDAHSTESFLPDYEKSEKEVIQDTTTFLIGAHKYGVSSRHMPLWHIKELRRNLDFLQVILLRRAIESSNYALIDTILDKEGWSSRRDPTESVEKLRSSALLEAVQRGDCAITRQALGLGARVNTRICIGETVLSFAVYESLVDHSMSAPGIRRVEYDSAIFDATTPLLLAAENGHEGIGRVEFDSAIFDATTPLLLAAENGHESIVKMLLDTEGIDVNSKDSMGRTPLSAAAGKGHESIVKMLLDTEGIDANSKDGEGCTPLLVAASKGYEEIVSMLLDTEGIEINSKNMGGCTPLSAAAGNGHESIVKMLLDADGIEVDSIDSMGQTPLIEASIRGYEAIVVMLLSTGKVDGTLRDSAEQTSRSYAIEYGHFGIVELLDQYTSV